MTSEVTRRLFTNDGSLVVSTHNVLSSRVVKGVVADEKGEPKPAVLVLLQQSRGTFADVVFTDPRVMRYLATALLNASQEMENEI